MKLDIASTSKLLNPRLVAKAMQAFDNVTVVIVSACWGGALLVMAFALYTVNLSVKAKQEVVAAAAMEPSLPVISREAPSMQELSPLVERLKKRFDGIIFVLGNDRSVTVSTVDVSKFREWMTVLSYVDTISPKIRWEIKAFCVGGRCGGSEPMKAVLAPTKISFSSPTR